MSQIQFPVLFLLTAQSFSTFGCKEYNHSDFSVDHLVMFMCRVFSCVFRRGCLLCMTSAFSWQNSISLCPASFCTPRLNLPVTPGVSQLPTFALQSPIMKRTSFLGVSSRSCRSSQNRSTSASSALPVGSQTWITMILNGLPWKRTEIILLFLRLHPSTTFWTS